jgi:hypothetical protein
VTGREDISYGKADVGKTGGNLLTSKTIIFKDERSAGDTVINTEALVAPSFALSNGFQQPNVETLANLNLLVNRKNLRVHSSRGAWLQEKEDFLVTSASTIQLIGNIAALGGALEGEVFTVYAVPVQSTSLLTTDVKRQHHEYVLPVGQSVLNLGREYEVGRHLESGSQIGAIRVWRNGVGPLLRNVDNVAADPLAEGNYQEINGLNGVGTSIEFNDPATGADDVVVVEFGYEYAGDLSIVGDIQSVYGGLLALANDVGPAIGVNPTDWLTANPSEVERRSFGDTVLSNIVRIAALEGLTLRTQQKAPAGLVNSNGAFITFNNLTVGNWYFVMAQASMTSNGGDNLNASVVHDSVNIVQMSHENNAGGGGDQHTHGSANFFQATTTTLTMEATGIVSVSTNIAPTNTFLRVVEIPFNVQEVGIW